MSLPRPLAAVLRIAAIVIVLFFLVRTVAANWARVRVFDWSVDPWLAALSVLLFVAGYALLPWIYSRVVRASGYGIRFGDAWDIYWLGNLGRYVPGKVWVILGVSWLAARRGIPRETAAASAVYAQVYSLLAAVVFFFIFLIFTGIHEQYARFLWLVAPMTVLVAAGLYPRSLEAMLNALLVRLGRVPLSVAVSTADAVRLVGWYLMSWIVMGVAFEVFVAAVAGWGEVNPAGAAVAYVVAYVAGFFALFAPGGIGVREGVLGVMLGPSLPVSVGIVIAALVRLAVTAIELVFAGISLSRKGLRNGKEETPRTDS